MSSVYSVRRMPRQSTKPVAAAPFSFSLPAVFDKDGEWIVASFPALAVSSQGRTRDEAASNLMEAAPRVEASRTREQ